MPLIPRTKNPLRKTGQPIDKPLSMKLNWAQIESAIYALEHNIRSAMPPLTTMVAISRGGFIPAGLLGFRLGVSDIRSIRIQRYENTFTEPHNEALNRSDIMFVDDLWDSGDTQHFLHKAYPLAKRAVLYAKRAADGGLSQHQSASWWPHYSGHVLPRVWIEFPWDYKDLPAPMHQQAKDLVSREDHIPF